MEEELGPSMDKLNGGGLGTMVFYSGRESIKLKAPKAGGGSRLRKYDRLLAYELPSIVAQNLVRDMNATEEMVGQMVREYKRYLVLLR